MKGYAGFPLAPNWGIHMKAKIALLTITAVIATGLTTGCATVDLGSVSTGVSAAPTASKTKVNVVQRAASKLYAAFTTKGWVTKVSRKRVQSTASVLLRGLDSETPDGPLSAYAAKAGSLSDIRADIYSAQQHVDQTTKAAEVYLAMAFDNTNLREELASLQKALIASRQAELVFKSAFEAKGLGADGTLIAYSKTVDRLRDVTDIFGDRVRRGNASQSTLTSALDYTIN